LAFSETEASELLKSRFGDGTIQTLADEIKAIKEALGLGNKK
jgi:hypothetical protein